MTLNKTKPTADIGSHRDTPEYDIDNPVFTPRPPKAGSQIKEPTIVKNQSTKPYSMSPPVINNAPSPTTNGTKTYVEGGITPNSNIVVNKPKPNYLVFGLLGIVGAFVIYKVFFNKKSE